MKGLFNNLGLKLFSLALSICLATYVYVYIDYPITQTITLPLRIKGLNSELMIANPVPQQVQVKLRGPYRSVQQITTGHLSAQLDCTEYGAPGSESARVQLPDFGDVAVTDQDYDFIEIQLERRAEKELAVIIEHQGDVAPEFEIAHEDVSRHNVEISGPQPLVEQIAKAVVRPDVSSVQQDRRYRLPVLLLDLQDQPVLDQSLKIEPEILDYSISLVPAGSISVLKVIPTFAGQPAKDYLLGEPVPSPLFITLDADLVEGEQRYIRTAPIELNHAKTSFTCQAKLDYPFKLPAQHALPESCDVFVEIIPLAAQAEAAVSLGISIVDGDNRYEYVITPPELIVRSEELLQLEREARASLKAVVSVAKLGPGEYRLAPQVSLPLQLDRVTIIPTTIKVTIIQDGN